MAKDFLKSFERHQFCSPTDRGIRVICISGFNIGVYIYIRIYCTHIYILYTLNNVVLFQPCLKMSLKGTIWLIKPVSWKVKFIHILPGLLLKVFSQHLGLHVLLIVFNFGPIKTLNSILQICQVPLILKKILIHVPLSRKWKYP